MSLIIKEMQIKTTVIYNLTAIRMAIFKNPEKNKCRQGCEGIGTPIHCWWKCKLVQLFWKTAW